ncbi:MAG: hypothetical protein LBS11_12010 [Oscillospiraceae bacterium]|jgi:hypothetical protein|nr:hypothetical protein [Oscillospiraceae bacterium]
MQAKLESEAEPLDGRDALDADDIELLDGTTDAPDDTISEPFENARAVMSQAASRVGQAFRAAWSRLVPNLSESGDDLQDEEDVEPEDGQADYDDPIGETPDEEEIIDDTDEHIIEMPPEERALRAASADPARQPRPDRLLSGKRRRPVTIHSPIARKPEPPKALAPLMIATPDNELSWDRARGILTVTEPILEDADPLEPSDARVPRRKRSVALTVRMLDERIVPVLLGVINAIDGDEPAPPAAGASDDTASPGAEDDNPRRVRRAERRVTQAAASDLPYVCESGPNTYCWYRAARLLRIYGQKRVDDKGLLHSSRCVELHVRSLPVEAKELFTEILAARARNDPYRAMV